MSTITVVTPAPDQDLTTIDDVKQRLGIKTNSEDANIRAWISDASDAIAVYLNRTLRQETVTEVFHSQPQGWGGTDETRDYFLSVFAQWGFQTQTLTRRPVASVTEVLDENNEALDPSLYIVNTDTALVRISNNRPRTFVWDALYPHGKITITYTAGYEQVSDVPRSLQRACIRQVSHWRASETRDPFIRSRTIPGVLETQYWVGGVGDNGALVPEVLDIIAKFRDVAA